LLLPFPLSVMTPSGGDAAVMLWVTRFVGRGAWRGASEARSGSAGCAGGASCMQGILLLFAINMAQSSLRTIVCSLGSKNFSAKYSKAVVSTTTITANSSTFSPAGLESSNRGYQCLRLWTEMTKKGAWVKNTYHQPRATSATV
jgi:hypothetical protein